jgi:hypothetical protein
MDILKAEEISARNLRQDIFNKTAEKKILVITNGGKKIGAYIPFDKLIGILESGRRSKK